MSKKEGLVRIVYVGRKPIANDNVARSGKQWRGFGDAHDVTPQQATVLLRYPDQWALHDPKNPPKAETSIEDNLKRMNEVHAQLANKPSGASLGGKRLEDMNEEELISHCAHFYGVDLDPKLSADEMRAEIELVVQRAGQEAEEARNKDMLDDKNEP